MKKIFLIFALPALLFASCSMNEEPVGTLGDKDAILNVRDALAFRNGLYVNLRDISNGGYITGQDLQSDNFVGMTTNGNRGGFWSNKTAILSNDTQNLAGLWAGPYGTIANCNYFLEKIAPMIADEKYSEQDKVELKRYRGEAYFTRAYCYWYITDRFCNSYTVIDPTSANTGVPIVTKYSPTSNYDAYPGRNTLSETFSQIENDLAAAYADIENFEKCGIEGAGSNMRPNAPYLSTYAIVALQARIALLKGDWETAIDKAEKVIAGPFELCSIDQYFNMWSSDSGSELIFLPYANNSQRGGVASIGETFNQKDGQTADYIPTANALDLYGSNEDERYNDVRFACFFEPRRLRVDGLAVLAPVFVKYPGNPEFNSGTSNDLKNLGKPFRLSEMYLILAEAAANSGNVDKANAALNDIREARLYDFIQENYTGETLIDQIRNERNKELIGEGFRISDLRRWKLGFSRSDNYGLDYTGVTSALVPASIQVTYSATDSKYVLPIPSHEMETNPQMVQNPGY